jgi:hypothetical protein
MQNVAGHSRKSMTGEEECWQASAFDETFLQRVLKATQRPDFCCVVGT